MLVGRETELATIDGLLAAARHGQGGALVLLGEPGVGKSALCAAAVARADGMRVVEVRGVETEAELAFTGLFELFGPLEADLPAVPDPQAAALSAAVGVGPPVAFGRFAVLAGTLSLLSASAAERPMLLVVDDAQWLDPASAEALIFAARRLESEDLALIFAVRSQEDRHGFLAAGLSQLELNGLDAPAAKAVLDERGGCRVASHVAEQIRAATRGNALALEETADGLSHDQLEGREALPEPLPLSDALVDAFGRRASALSKDARRALGLAAAASTEIGRAHV
jgi:predicted ATPase